MNSAYSNQFRHQISAVTDSFNFFDQISPKKLFLVENRKNEYDHGILHIWSLTSKFQLRLTIFIFD